MECSSTLYKGVCVEKMAQKDLFLTKIRSEMFRWIKVYFTPFFPSKFSFYPQIYKKIYIKNNNYTEIEQQQSNAIYQKNQAIKLLLLTNGGK